MILPRKQMKIELARKSMAYRYDRKPNEEYNSSISIHKTLVNIYNIVFSMHHLGLVFTFREVEIHFSGFKKLYAKGQTGTTIKLS
jgi:hypothetical protein